MLSARIVMCSAVLLALLACTALAKGGRRHDEFPTSESGQGGTGQIVLGKRNHCENCGYRSFKLPEAAKSSSLLIMVTTTDPVKLCLSVVPKGRVRGRGNGGDAHSDRACGESMIQTCVDATDAESKSHLVLFAQAEATGEEVVEEQQLDFNVFFMAGAPDSTCGRQMCKNDPDQEATVCLALGEPSAALCRDNPFFQQSCKKTCSLLGHKYPDCSAPHKQPTPCEAARTHDINSGHEVTGEQVTQCEANGSFSQVQCSNKEEAKACWCVDSQGVLVPDTMEPVDTEGNLVQPNCPVPEVVPSLEEQMVSNGIGAAETHHARAQANYTVFGMTGVAVALFALVAFVGLRRKHHTQPQPALSMQDTTPAPAE